MSSGAAWVPTLCAANRVVISRASVPEGAPETKVLSSGSPAGLSKFATALLTAAANPYPDTSSSDGKQAARREA